jgi:hypothetical protein
MSVCLDGINVGLRVVWVGSVTDDPGRTIVPITTMTTIRVPQAAYVDKNHQPARPEKSIPDRLSSDVLA